MTAWWAESGLTGPVKLMNRDNTAAATTGSSAARQHAINVSGAGGVKATTLAGAIFNNKDNKKGQQDTLQAFLITKLGYSISFPDTSNICYHSHCNAATELILHHSLYLEFLELVQAKKESGSFTNMEQNLYRALQDTPTLTELAVLCLYSICICLPYLKRVRGDTSTSALDLGPLHDDVKAYCAAIIHNPGLLLDCDASYTSGCLFGEAWEQPEAFYAVHALMPNLPHIKGALVAFFTGALATWKRFTREFAADGIVTTTTAAECARAWMPATNDANEGALGEYRVAKRRWPNLTLAQYNSRKMYAKNNTGAYIIQAFDTPEKYAFLRKAAREWNKRESEQKRLEKQGFVDQELGNTDKTRRVEKKKKRDNAKALLDARLGALKPNLDPDQLAKSPGTVKDIDLQLEWHRWFDPHIPKKTILKRKAEKLDALIEAVNRLNNGEVKIAEVEEVSENGGDTEEDVDDESPELE